MQIRDAVADDWPEIYPIFSAIIDEGRTIDPNRPGRGSHIATASFMVDPSTRRRGVGRALGEHMLSWAQEQGYRGVQFNAVVETNEAAIDVVRLAGDLG